MSPRRRNQVVVAAVAILGLGVMAYEGYLWRVDLAFATFATFVFVLASSAAKALSTRRLLAVMAIAGTGGLATQAVGIAAGAWHYHSDTGTHAFVAFAFAIGAVGNVGLVHRVARCIEARRGASSTVARVAVAAIATGLVLGLGARSVSSAELLVGYYSLLVAWAAAMTVRQRPGVVLACLVVGAGYGLVAEWSGARCGLWSFTAGTVPAWLVLASWPLETLLHVAASAVVTGEVETPDAPAWSPA